MGCVVARATLPQTLPCVQHKYVSVVMELGTKLFLRIENGMHSAPLGLDAFGPFVQMKERI